MKLIVLAVLAVVAAVRGDYHDNVFHFSTLRSPAQHFNNYYQPQATEYISSQYPSATAAPTYYSPEVVLQTLPLYRPAATVYSSNQVPVTTSYSSPRSSYTPYTFPANHHHSGYASGYASAYAPAYSGAQYRILKQEQEADPSGPYRMYYVTENGISASEEGSLTAPGPEGPAVAKTGSYSYTGPDGVQYTVNWVADENGFRASGAHLPQAPGSATVQAEVQAPQSSLYYRQLPATVSAPFPTVFGSPIFPSSQFVYKKK